MLPSISKSTGLGLIGFSEAYNELKPDLVIVLGDRYEILAAATAALFARIPIGHIHGGETTEGAFDEAIRHSITKMAWWHFVAAEEYRKRVIQLGEDPERVHLVGGLGVDGICKAKLLNKNDLEKVIDFKFGKKNLLVTFHPITLDNETSKKQFEELLSCLDKLNDTNIIFTSSNSDTGGRIINSKQVCHGKVHQMKHFNNSIIFKDINVQFQATRYHSLIGDKVSFPGELEITAISCDDQEIMGVQHEDYKIFGLQFHPESIETKDGIKMIKNFIEVI